MSAMWEVALGHWEAVGAAAGENTGWGGIPDVYQVTVFPWTRLWKQLPRVLLRIDVLMG